jgi:hypothetical protein
LASVSQLAFKGGLEYALYGKPAQVGDGRSGSHLARRDC